MGEDEKMTSPAMWPRKKEEDSKIKSGENQQVGKVRLHRRRLGGRKKAKEE